MEDVIEDILLRLPVEDLTRYKIVCKSWFSLISSPRFSKAHLKQQQQQQNNNSSDTNKELGHVRISMPSYWKVPNESSYQFNTWDVVGSSNGLVCFTPFSPDAPLLVNNPRTREIRKLPLVWPQEEFGLGFGYDSSTDDYKLVMWISKGLTGNTLIQVLSLKSNTWKPIGEVKYMFFNNRPGILFNGALHWLALDYNASEEKRVILSFDLSREEFTAIPEPADSKYERCTFNSHSYVGILEGQLCIFFTNRDNDLPCNIWVMNSCSKGERFWEPLPDNYEIKYEVVHHMKILECTSSTKNRMTFFCDDNKCLSRSRKHIIKAPLFVPSLVSPYAASSSHRKHYKTSVKSWSPKGPKGESQDPQATVRRFIIKTSEQRIKEIEAEYRLEVGETENFYFHEGNREIKEIVTKIESNTLRAEGVKNNE